MILPLVTPDHPALWAVSEPVLSFDDPSLHTLIRDLKDTIAHHRGLGLAAPQIGVSRRVFLFKDGMNGEVTVAINPHIVSLIGGPTEAVGPEGCLTWPGEWVMKKGRARGVCVQYWDEMGKPHTVTLLWLGARCFQHEMDHLDGVCLFPRPVPVEPLVQVSLQ